MFFAGDIHFVFFPEAPKKDAKEEAKGVEQRNARPAILMQDESHQLPTVLAIPITKNLSWATMPAALIASPSKTNGLKEKSCILGFQLTSIGKTWVGTELGACDPEIYKRMKQEIGRILKLC